jgi:hypothetical protein
MWFRTDPEKPPPFYSGLSVWETGYKALAGASHGQNCSLHATPLRYPFIAMAAVGAILNNTSGRAQRDDGISLSAFLASLTVSFTCLLAGLVIFLFLKDRFARV